MSYSYAFCWSDGFPECGLQWHALCPWESSALCPVDDQWQRRGFRARCRPVSARWITHWNVGGLFPSFYSFSKFAIMHNEILMRFCTCEMLEHHGLSLSRRTTSCIFYHRNTHQYKCQLLNKKLKSHHLFAWISISQCSIVHLVYVRVIFNRNWIGLNILKNLNPKEPKIACNFSYESFF